MNRGLQIAVSIVLLIGTVGVSHADTTTAPAKKPIAAATKTAPPVAKAAPRPATSVAHAPTQLTRAAPSAAALQAVATGAGARSPASVMGASGNGSSKDISEELKIMGQSRNLSMGLLFQKDKDKLTFGTPRTNYEDKVSDKKANF
jgi:hypothetical protein